MKSAVSDVRAFMEVAEQPVRTTPTQIKVTSTEREILNEVAAAILVACRKLKELGDGTTDGGLRARLVLEESAELVEAIVDNDLVGIADACVDIDYVTIGTALAYGLPHAAAWNAVHAANMAKATLVDGKLTMVRDAGGKVIKPDGWKPADLRAILRISRSLVD